MTVEIIPTEKNMPKKQNKNSILEQLLHELEQEVAYDESLLKITKGQALIKTTVNEALGGDKAMMANMLKFMEKLDALQVAKRGNKKVELSKEDREIIRRFRGE